MQYKNQILPVKDKLVREILHEIEEKKGNETIVINLQKFDNVIADYFIITDTTSSTQSRAISEHIQKNISKKHHLKPFGVEGEENAEWILLDYGNIIVHIFQKSTREYYDLEGLWADAEIFKSNV